MKYYTIHEASEMLGVSAQTLRNWDKSGKLKPHHKGKNGYRYYSTDDLTMLLGVKNMNGKTLGYCRISCYTDESELEKQKQEIKTYLLAQGKPFEIIADIGSGLDYQRPGFQKLIKGMADRSIAKVVILEKDRLLRIGFEMIQYLAAMYGCEIEIVEQSEYPDQDELSLDFLQILSLFQKQMQGENATAANQAIQQYISYEEKKGKRYE